MAFAPEVWAAVERVHGPLPAKGQQIRCTLRNGDTLTGTVELVWLAMDEPVINLGCHGATVRVWPGLGDVWETRNGLTAARQGGQYRRHGWLSGWSR